MTVLYSSASSARRKLITEVSRYILSFLIFTPRNDNFLLAFTIRPYLSTPQ